MAGGQKLAFTVIREAGFEGKSCHDNSEKLMDNDK